MAAAAALATPALYPAFFFVLGKAVKRAGNAVIPTLSLRYSHSPQRLLKHPLRYLYPTSINGYYTAKNGLGTIVYKTAHVRFHRRKRAHTRLCSKNRTQRLTRRNTGRFGWGRYYYPRSVPHVSETLRGRGLKRQTLPLLGLGRGCSQRTQKAFGAAMRLCASLFRRRRGPAGLRDLFRFCRNCGLYALRSGPFRVCEARGGITTLSALYVLLKRRTPACQNGSFAVF